MQILTVVTIENQKQGVHIGFYSEENVVKESYFQISILDKKHDFQVIGIKVEETATRSILYITAKEVGYWGSTLDRKGTDLRTIMGCLVVAVTDEQEIKQIKENSSYC